MADDRTPHELRRTLGEHCRSWACDMDRGVYVYENTLSGEMRLLIRDGTDWHTVCRAQPPDVRGMLALLRRLGVEAR